MWYVFPPGGGHSAVTFEKSIKQKKSAYPLAGFVVVLKQMFYRGTPCPAITTCSLACPVYRALHLVNNFAEPFPALDRVLANALAPIWIVLPLSIIRHFIQGVVMCECRKYLPVLERVKCTKQGAKKKKRESSLRHSTD
jgi:hypothetical protein